MKRKLTVGLLLYRNDEFEIERCLEGLKNQSRHTQILEILIRDQGGGDSLRFANAWIAENKSNLVFKCSTGENIGFGRGHNTLFEMSSPDSSMYICLNPDATMHPDCLEHLLKVAAQTNYRGIYEARHEPIMHPKHYNPTTGTTPWCSGACLMIPSEIYRELSGFDEDFFLYCEDVDLSWRVRAAGYECYTCSDAMVLHYALDRSEREAEIWKSACILARKWRADRFSSDALKKFSGIVDIQQNELRDELQKIDQHAVEKVLRVAPDFKHMMTFAPPMWRDGHA